MINKSSLRTVILFISLIAFVVAFSILFSVMWGGKSEQLPESRKLIIEKDMTIAQFGRANNLPNAVLKQIFDLKEKSDLINKISDYGSVSDVASMVRKKLALALEQNSKNWSKIVGKFALWFIFLAALFIFLKKHKLTSTTRKWLLFSSVIIFGIIMGSDPSPMGTIKDAIHLFATERVIFAPRMIALTIFLIIVFFANKYICAWGCQFGTLQDMIFRINSNNKRKSILGRQIKPPFIVSNTIRVVTFLVFTVIAFAWGIDLIGEIDPFRLFNPLTLRITGGVAIGLLLILSLFIYRPWCHLFCPFGLVGWLVEMSSLFKIRVNYKTCIACGKCALACPSTVMSAILKRNKRVIPDCYACNTCMEVCPTESIKFSIEHRAMPPEDHFDKRKK